MDYNLNMTKDQPTSIRLDAETKKMWEQLAKVHGISRNAVVVMLIRREARRLKVKDETKGQGNE